jgi:lipoyl(octanoyl) transferase
MMRECWAFNLGRINYAEALNLQRDLVTLRQRENLPELLLSLEHNHVITFGRAGREVNLLSDQESLKKAGVEVFHIERGGDVTYHGPGQLVGYPIFDLNHWNKDLHLFLRNLEEVIMQTLQEYELKAERIKGLTGVWVKGKKVAAIGVAVKKWITLHGFALNVNTDLSYFRFIHPCGIVDKPVSSMKELLGEEVNLEKVSRIVGQKFSEVFGLIITEKSKGSLQQLLTTQPSLSG